MGAILEINALLLLLLLLLLLHFLPFLVALSAAANDNANLQLAAYRSRLFYASSTLNNRRVLTSVSAVSVGVGVNDSLSHWRAY